MGKKAKIFTIFLIVLGGATIPGGFILNNYIDNLLYENVDTGLSGIEEQFIPTAEQMILDMGPALALPIIQNQSIPIIVEMIQKLGPTIALDLIQQTSLPIVEDMIQKIGPAIALDVIQQNSLPIIEDMIQEVGPAIALSTIRELAVPLVEKEIYKVGPAIGLQIIKEIAVPANRLMVNASFLAQLLYQAYLEGMTHSMDILGYHVDGGDALLNLFFDYNDLFLGTTLLGGLGTTSFSEQLEANDLPPILGVSEWWSDIQGSDIDLEIGACDYALLGQIPQPNPNDILSWGDPSQKQIDLWQNNPPGFIQHTEKGFGILDFLTNFTIANETGMHSEFLSQYYEGRTLNWNDFEILARFFNEYWVPVVMPILLGELQDPNSEFSKRAPEYVGMSLDDISYYEFLKQWINYSTYPLGVDFNSFIEEIPVGTYGLEVNSTISTNSAYALWDESDECSFLNTTGILKWFDANSSDEDKLDLAMHFGLNSQQVSDICNWLWGKNGFSNQLFPLLVTAPDPYGYDMSIKDLSRKAFYELWANGTALGLALYPDGIDFGEFFPDEFELDTTGFEVGIPVPTTLSFELAKALWNESYPFSLTNITGIQLWADANSSSTSKDELYNGFLNFGITFDQIDQILHWLWKGPSSFSQLLLPTLINSSLGYGMDIKQLAKHVLYEQWANGTTLGLSLFPEGLDFGEFIDELPLGTVGFEVGIPIKTEMPIELVDALWNENDEKSLLNIVGIQLWFDANTSIPAQATLLSKYESLSLTQVELDQLLQWLWYPGGFVDELFPKLVESPPPYGYGKPIPKLAEQVFFEMWANGTALGLNLFPDGLDFGEFIDDLPLGTTGFEVGIPMPTGMSFDLTKALWNENDEKSLLNITGIEFWFDANTSIAAQAILLSKYENLGLTQVELDQLLQWLWYPGGFVDELFPKLVRSPPPYGYGKPIPQLAEQVFFEMWANGTTLGLNLFPDGLDFGEFIDELPLGMSGFEVGIPIPTMLLLTQIKNLWDSSNPLSLTNITGIEKWKEAFINHTTRNELKIAFNLSEDQIQLILNWLWDGPSSFSLDLLPKLLESELGYNMTINEFAYRLFLEQWANGTIMGMVLFPGGIDFHEFIPSLPTGTTGFEVGIPIPTNMSIDSALLLWDPSNAYSLVNDIQVWWKIGSKFSTNFNVTRDTNLLSDKAMDMILQWLPNFKNELLPLLAQYDMNLPMDATSLGNMLQLGMIIGGTIILGVSSTTLTYSTVVSRKKKKLGMITSKKPIDKLNKYKQDSSLKENVEVAEDKSSEPESAPNKSIEDIEIKKENVEESDIQKPEIDDESEINKG